MKRERNKIFGQIQRNGLRRTSYISSRFMTTFNLNELATIQLCFSPPGRWHVSTVFARMKSSSGRLLQVLHMAALVIAVPALASTSGNDNISKASPTWLITWLFPNGWSYWLQQSLWCATILRANCSILHRRLSCRPKCPGAGKYDQGQG